MMADLLPIYVYGRAVSLILRIYVYMRLHIIYYAHVRVGTAEEIHTAVPTVVTKQDIIGGQQRRRRVTVWCSIM